jgi:hypothetical protein
VPAGVKPWAFIYRLTGSVPRQKSTSGKLTDSQSIRFVSFLSHDVTACTHVGTPFALPRSPFLGTNISGEGSPGPSQAASTRAESFRLYDQNTSSNRFRLCLHSYENNLIGEGSEATSSADAGERSAANGCGLSGNLEKWATCPLSIRAQE